MKPPPLPLSNTPGGYTPGGYTPGGYTPGGYTPGGYTPGGCTPGGYTQGGYTQGGYTPGGYTGVYTRCDSDQFSVRRTGGHPHAPTHFIWSTQRVGGRLGMVDQWRADVRFSG